MREKRKGKIAEGKFVFESSAVSQRQTELALASPQAGLSLLLAPGIKEGCCPCAGGLWNSACTHESAGTIASSATGIATIRIKVSFLLCRVGCVGEDKGKGRSLRWWAGRGSELKGGGSGGGGGGILLALLQMQLLRWKDGRHAKQVQQINK